MFPVDIFQFICYTLNNLNQTKICLYVYIFSIHTHIYVYMLCIYIYICLSIYLFTVIEVINTRGLKLKWYKKIVMKITSSLLLLFPPLTPPSETTTWLRFLFKFIQFFKKVSALLITMIKSILLFTFCYDGWGLSNLTTTPTGPSSSPASVSLLPIAPYRNSDANASL